MKHINSINGGVKLPIDEIIKIQEVLLPLGYEIRGYRDGFCSSYELTLYLAKNSLPKNLKGLPAIDNPVAFNDPDDGFQSAE